MTLHRLFLHRTNALITSFAQYSLDILHLSDVNELQLQNQSFSAIISEMWRTNFSRFLQICSAHHAGAQQKLTMLGVHQHRSMKTSPR